MNENQLSRVAKFVTGLERLSQDVGVRIHAHGSPMAISDFRNGDDAPFDLIVDFGNDSPSYLIKATR